MILGRSRDLSHWLRHLVADPSIQPPVAVERVSLVFAQVLSVQGLPCLPVSPLAGFYGWSIDNVSVVGFVPEGVATRALASAMADGSVTVDLEWGARVPALDVGFQRWHVGWIRSIRTVARDPAIHIADLVGEWWHT